MLRCASAWRGLNHLSRQTHGNAESKVSREYVLDALKTKVPLFADFDIGVTALSHGHCVLDLPYSERFVRPGGTITGPVMFALADLAMWAAVMSAVGPVELAVTTSMSISFLRKPLETGLVADAKIIKLGKRLAYGDIGLFAAAAAAAGASGHGAMVAHATGTYSLPDGARPPAAE